MNLFLYFLLKLCYNWNHLQYILNVQIRLHTVHSLECKISHLWPNNTRRTAQHAGVLQT